MDELQQKKIEAYELMRKIGDGIKETQDLQAELRKKEEEIGKLEGKEVKK